jgi:hypothetical protein
MILCFKILGKVRRHYKERSRNAVESEVQWTSLNFDEISPNFHLGEVVASKEIN